MSVKLALAVIALSAATTLCLADEPKPAQAAAAKPAVAKPAVNLDDVRAFASVFSLIKQAYVEPVDDKTLMQAAIRGLLGNLDPHSEYLDQKAMETLSEDTSADSKARRCTGFGTEPANAPLSRCSSVSKPSANTCASAR